MLNSRNATLVQNGGMTRVTLLHKDGGRPAVAAPIARDAGASGGAHTEIYPLRYVSAGDMQRVLEKALPASATVSPDEGRHILLVQGAPAELQLARGDRAHLRYRPDARHVDGAGATAQR